MLARMVIYISLIVGMISEKRKEKNDMKTEHDKQRVESLVIRVSPDVKETIRQNAKDAGQTMSAYAVNKCLKNDYGINMIVFQTELLEMLNHLKAIHSDERESVEIIDNIASKIGGFGYADHKNV